MAELSIIKRMAAFIEHVHQSTGALPANILISPEQRDEMAAEAGLPVQEQEGAAYSFWGVPLIVIKKEDTDVTPSIQSH